MITTNISKLSRRGVTFLVALALVLTLFAGQAWAQEDPAPTVTSRSPEGTVQGANSVTATFSELMDPATVETAFTLTRNGTEPVGATFGYEGDPANTATLTPDAPLVEGVTYTANVSTEATDASGTPLAAAETWTFTVDATPPSISLTAPDEARNSVNVSASAGDDAVGGVEFSLGGTSISDTTDPYEATFDTSTLTHGTTHTITARVADAVGNDATASRSFTIDRQVNLTLSGGPTAGGFTNDPAPLAFTTDDDVAAADRECRAVRAGATTTPPFVDCDSPYDPTLTQDGSYTYEVRVTDNVGNTDTRERTFTLDRTNPEITINNGPNGGTFGPDSTQTWTFTRSDATSGVDTVECRVAAQGADPAYENCGTTNSYSVTNRPDGSHTFSVRVTDRAGNQTTQTRTFSIDATPPTISLTAPADGLKVRNSVNVAATTAGGAVRVEFLVDGNQAQSDTTSPYEASLDTSALADGPHTVAARAVDAFGNVATSASRSIVVDHQVSPPNIFDGPAEGALTNASSVSFAFTVDSDVPASGIECRAVRPGTPPAPAYADCSSPHSPNLTQDGAYRYDVRVTDDVGNSATASRSFTLDRTDPALTIGNGPNNGQIFAGDSTQTWNFAAGDAHLGPVQCSVVAQGAGPVYGDCTTGTSHSVSNLTGGSYTFSVRARDNAGNETVLTRSFTIDAQAPGLSIDGPANGQKVGRTVSVSASASDAPAGVASVAFLVNGTVRETDTAAPFAADLNLGALAHGSNPTILVRATDGVGNRAEISRTVNLDLQVSSPTLGASPAAGGFTNATSVPLSFDTDPDVAQRECRVNRTGAPAGTFVSCASPFEPSLTQDGSYTYEVRVTDDVGNQTTVSRSFTLDRTNPTLALTGGPDGGTFGPNTTQSWAFNAGDATSGPPAVQCSVAAVGAPAFGDCAASASHSVSNRPDGTYEFSVRATDKAGNRSVFSTRPIRIDATNPTANLTAPATGTKVGRTMNITFNASDDLTAAPRVDILVDGVVRAPVPGSRTPTSAALNMDTYDQDSSHTVAVRATDGVGNQSARSEVNVTVDKETQLDITDAPAPGATNAASVPISFTADTDVPAAGQECQVERGGTILTPFGPCTSPFAPDLTEDGSYIYRVRVTDDVGNKASAARAFTLDRTAPTLTVNGPEDQAVVGPTDVLEYTFASDDATTRPTQVRCSVTPLGANPNYVACNTATTHTVSNANRSDGGYEFRVRATDGANNVTEVVRGFNVDRTPPAVTIDSGLADGASTNKGDLTWAFSSIEPDAAFQCRVFASGTTPAPFEPNSCSGAGVHRVTGLGPGKYTFQVRGLDRFGNRLNGPSATRDFTVDTSAPRVLRVSPAARAARTANVSAVFSEGMDLSTLTRSNFKLTRAGTANPVAAKITLNETTNTATLNPMGPLVPGATYRATVTTGTRDLAGNPLAVTRTWSFKVR